MGSSQLLLDMRHSQHPELGGLIEPSRPTRYPPMHQAYCLDCGKFWGSMSLDSLYDDVGWHLAMFPGRHAHVVHVWEG